MYNNFHLIKTEVYDKCSLLISDFEIEKESQEYYACRFKLNNQFVLSRHAKITPKKVGQFVTFWKRNSKNSIEPFHEDDQIDFYIVNVISENKSGQFVFPKSILIKKGIMTTSKREGKRGFRVYPRWDMTLNKQAETTQKWQLDYFYELDSSINLDKVSALYKY